MAGLKLVGIAVVCMVLALAAVDAAITCGMVTTYVSPCISYVRGGAGGVPSKCCEGIRNLNNAAKTTPDRQATCKCLKMLASTPGIKLGLVASLPGMCGVSIPYKISPSTDCNKVT